MTALAAVGTHPEQRPTSGPIKRDPPSGALPGNAAAPGRATEGERTNQVTELTQDSTADTAELAVIGAMLAPPPLDVLRAAVARLESRDFGNVRARFLFDVVVRMASAGIPPDLVSVPGFVRQHAIELPTLLTRHLATVCHEIATAAPVPASLGFYVDLVLMESARRRLNAAARRLAAIADAGDAEIVARCLEAVGQVAL